MFHAAPRPSSGSPRRASFPRGKLLYRVGRHTGSFLRRDNRNVPGTAHRPFPTVSLTGPFFQPSLLKTDIFGVRAGHTVAHYQPSGITRVYDCSGAYRGETVNQTGTHVSVGGGWPTNGQFPTQSDYIGFRLENYERVPLAEHVRETLNVLDCIEDLKIPDAVAVAPEQYEEALEKLQSGDSSE